jgi:uncharacterized protein with NRDE domain
MCLVLFAHAAHPDYALVLATNRDEFFARPTQPADYWEDAPQVLAGRDLEKGGTWMGVAPGGRWAAVTNFRDGVPPPAGLRSRGELTARYLAGSDTAQDYAREVAASRAHYPGFNLLVGDGNGVYYVSQAAIEPVPVLPGLHGLSNHRLDTSWPKVERGKRALADAIATGPARLEEDLLALLADRTLADDRSLPSTGIAHDWEKRLSAAFITAPGYGTRASTVLIVGTDGEARFRERSFGPDGEFREDRMFRFSTDRAVVRA